VKIAVKNVINEGRHWFLCLTALMILLFLAISARRFRYYSLSPICLAAFMR